MDEPAPVAPGPGRDERGALEVEPSPTIPPSQARAVWYDPTGEQAPGMDQPPPRSPLSPVVAPRGERRARFLGPLLAALLLVLVVGGAAFAVDKARDGNDNRDAADATGTARTLAIASSPVATATTPAESTEAVKTPTKAAPTAPQATATPKPTQEPAKSAAVVASPTKPAGTKGPTPRPSSLRAPDFLPAVSDLPEGFEQTADDKYSKDEMIAQLGDNGTDLVAEWEWRENAYRYFVIPESASPDPKSTSSLTVSVHRFRTRDGATAALTGLADIVLAGGEYQEVDVEKIADQSRALTSETTDGNTYVLYIRIANFVIRFGGYSATGDPSQTVIDLAKKIAEG